MLRQVRRFHLTDNPRLDILSGITVAIALVPEAIAFAFVAGVPPLVGLWAASIVGFITAVFGGRSGMISGATGALAVVMVYLVKDHGIEYLFAALILMGIIQIFAGVLRLGKFIRLVPYPVMLGFVNGFAIVIFLAQIGQFKNYAGQWYPEAELMVMFALIALTMAIILVLPRYFTLIPATLVAIIAVTLISLALPWSSATVGSVLAEAGGSMKGGLPQFSIPEVPFTLETLQIILMPAFVFAGIGLIESLLTLNLIDEKTNTRGRMSQECIGQGLANLTCGFFGAMGGCAMIGQSMININSGGRGRLSSLTAAIVLALFILLVSPLVEIIPIATLVGVMVIVVIKTFAWPSLKLLTRIPKEDAFIIILVTAVTVAKDLAVAVIVGVIVSALVFAWKSARHIWVTEARGEKGEKVYQLQGPLFFGSIAHFRTLFDIDNDPSEVIIDFKNSRVWDHSALEAIDALALKYKEQGKNIQLVHLSADCALLLHKAKDSVKINMIEDPNYRVFADYSKEIEEQSA